MNLFLTLLLVFFLWAVFGSFGGVLLMRLANGVTRQAVRNILVWRSHSDIDGHVLKRYELLPIVSFLWQRGKCRTTWQSLDPLYVILEVGSWFVFLCSFLWYSDRTVLSLLSPAIIFWMLLHWLLFLLLIRDRKTYYLHVPVRVLTVWIASALVVVQSSLARYWHVGSAWWVVVFFVLLWRLWKRYVTHIKRQHVMIADEQVAEWFGQGDVYLSVIIGILLPLVMSVQGMMVSVLFVVSTFFVYMTMCGFVGLMLFGVHRLVSRNNPNWTTLPFIPAMVISFWILVVRWKEITIFVFW